MLVYFLAFKLHCLKNEKEEALEMFELMQQSEHEMDTALLLEVFNVISGTNTKDEGTNKLSEMTTLSLSIAGFILEHFSKLVQHDPD